jgi:glucosamine--fructose-6-phosphate aminotransferase (isomerizing)
MCGVFGYVGRRQALPVILTGLRLLEYRGYDSAGVALISSDIIRVAKTVGGVRDLEAHATAAFDSVASGVGIGHTRWATNGMANDVNAHPHLDTAGRIAIVHNGIIENADILRARLATAGVRFRSDTDSEVIAHLISQAYERGAVTPAQAVREVTGKLTGRYAFIAIDAEHPDLLVAACYGSPLVLGAGSGEMFAASDAGTFSGHACQATYLRDGDIAVLRADRYVIADDGDGAGERRVVREPAPSTDSDAEPATAWHRHCENLMAREIGEQPEALERLLRAHVDTSDPVGLPDQQAFALAKAGQFTSVHFIGCGSAYYAGQLGAFMVERFARIQALAEPASEFRYREPVIDPERTLYVMMSQSGETADTLMAAESIKERGGQVMGIVNVQDSAIARRCTTVLPLLAGPEIAVASTKAVTNMMAACCLLAVALSKRSEGAHPECRRLIAGLLQLPALIRSVLAAEHDIAAVAERYSSSSSMFFIGRGAAWPCAREGAQKVKEISYIHAEAYQAGELKHGPLALISAKMPSVVLIPRDELRSRNMSTIQQISAREGPVIAVASADLPAGTRGSLIRIPASQPELEPIIMNISMQIYAMRVARILGRNVDKPRNLAKSVTVE